MIRIHRDRKAVPPAFTADSRRAKELTLLKARRDHLVRLASDPRAAHGYNSAWWKVAKPQLRIESHGKCAYCEARADAVAHCDVEHFRPKAIWWWLTCCWDNYVFACQLCNQTFKSDHFPLSGSPIAPVVVTSTTSDARLQKLAGRLAPDPVIPAEITAWLKKLKREKSHLVDPASEDPEALLAWEVDDEASEISVIPRGGSKAVQRSVAACIEFYGLNREELRQLRYEVFEGIDTARIALAVAGLTVKNRRQLLKRLQRTIAPEHQFAGMCRYFIIDVWKLLPPEARGS